MQHLKTFLGDEKRELDRLIRALRKVEGWGDGVEERRYRIRTRLKGNAEKMLGHIGLRLPPLIEGIGN